MSFTPYNQSFSSRHQERRPPVTRDWSAWSPSWQRATPSGAILRSQQMSPFDRFMWWKEEKSQPAIGPLLEHAEESLRLGQMLNEQLRELHIANQHPQDHSRQVINNTNNNSNHLRASISPSLVAECRTRAVQMRRMCAWLSLSSNPNPPPSKSPLHTIADFFSFSKNEEDDEDEERPNVPAEVVEQCLMANDVLQEAIRCLDFDNGEQFGQVAVQSASELQMGEDSSTLGRGGGGAAAVDAISDTTTTNPSNNNNQTTSNDFIPFSSQDKQPQPQPQQELRRRPISSPSPTPSSSSSIPPPSSHIELEEHGVKLLANANLLVGSDVMTQAADLAISRADIVDAMRLFATPITAVSHLPPDFSSASLVFYRAVYRTLELGMSYGLKDRAVADVAARITRNRRDLRERAVGIAREMGYSERRLMPLKV